MLEGIEAISGGVKHSLSYYSERIDVLSRLAVNVQKNIFSNIENSFDRLVYLDALDEQMNHINIASGELEISLTEEVIDRFRDTFVVVSDNLAKLNSEVIASKAVCQSRLF